MSQERWTAVDSYITEQFLPPDPVLEGALQSSAVAGLPPISVSAPQGALLHLLARIHGARRVLEIDPRHAEVARANLARAGLTDRVDLRLGNAHETLPALAAEGLDPFDLCFIDADKASAPAYLDWALRLSRTGSLIILDNVVRGGAVADAGSRDPNVLGSRTVSLSPVPPRP